MRRYILLWILVLVGSCPTVRATVNVSPSSGVSKVQVSGKWRITITATPSLTTLYTITGTSGDDIEWIRVNNNGSPTSSVRLDIGGSLNNVEEIVRSGGDGQVWIIGLDIDGDLGSMATGTTGDIRVHIITEDNDIGGDILGYIFMLFRPNGDSTIEALNVGGDVLSSIRNANGPILELNVAGDISGLSASNPIGIVASGGIGTINATNIIDVGFPGPWPESPSTIGSIVLSGSIDDGGNPTPGVLKATQIGELSIGGDVDSQIEIVSGGPGGVAIQGVIGGSITSSGSITVPSGKINGQIVINGGQSHDAESESRDISHLPSRARIVKIAPAPSSLAKPA